MSLSCILILFSVILENSLCSDNIEPSPDQIRQYFQLDPETPYELVHVEFLDRLEKRNVKTLRYDQHVKLRAFGDDINLWLHPPNSKLISKHTPVFFSTYDQKQPANVYLKENRTLMQDLGDLFEDEQLLASLIIGEDERGARTINGYIGAKKMIVRSFPIRLFSDSTQYSTNHVNHMIHKIKDEESIAPQALTRRPQGRRRSKKGRKPRVVFGVPNTLYPEILVLVDYSLYNPQKYNILGFLAYLVAFWNGVDLKFRVLQQPRIRLHVSAIILGEEPKSIPFIGNYMLSDVTFDARAGIKESYKFFYEFRYWMPFISYDVAVTMTRHYFGFDADSTVRGLAHTGAACEDPSYKGRMRSATLIRDNGLFMGIPVAAHELGHLMGMKHDDIDSIKECNMSEGYIMATEPHFAGHSETFSRCSLWDLEDSLRMGRLDCMYNLPINRGARLPKIMPGRLTSLMDQCAFYELGPPCNLTNVNVCKNLHCFNHWNKCVSLNEATVEGTICSSPSETNKRFCIHGQCVDPIRHRFLQRNKKL